MGSLICPPHSQLFNPMIIHVVGHVLDPGMTFPPWTEGKERKNEMGT
ncbi:MAG TPA: hypothetical protein VI895_13715 [Bdellovibrionota bacterium]|nr:hypothetical protein [Bdellovibrionota bacterium]